MLAAFASPDFQFNILEAQRSAARSSSGDDLDLLVDILAQRAEFTETPRLKMATRKALDVRRTGLDSDAYGPDGLMVWDPPNNRPS